MVEVVAAAEEEVEDLVVVETEMEGIGMEVEVVTDMEEVGDTTETGMVVDSVEAAVEVLIEEAMVGTGTDRTDQGCLRNYTATHVALFLFNCNINTTYK